MIKGPKDILILFLALVTLTISVIFMPWAELNFTGNFPDWINAVTSFFGVDKFFNALGANSNLMSVLKSSDIQNNLGDYAYSLFLFGAVTASAIAFVLVGREEDTEKTILEVKK